MVAVEDLSFNVARGEVVGFLGPNGAGKSTTMRIISGSLGASSGTAKVGGIDVANEPRKVQAMLGYAPEVPPVYTNMTVKDYVSFAATLKRVPDVEAATKLALGRVGLDKVASRLIDHLSKGYRQRVGLAQALVHDPKVLVLDEPTSGLDPAQRVEIRNLLAELVMRHGEGDGLRHRNMLHQHLVHLHRRHLLAAAIDDLLETPRDLEEAVLVHEALVARVEPAEREACLVG
jgi:ABC-2 type transport system ATP-binding protein